ncbi:hypothetical protein BGX38DRAFT_1264275 [Terfezia claveryi]|nr:hypothetical protein BGX38DRAFT_1264275 [Terfezia claveryi]
MPIANIVRSGRIAATGCARLYQSTHFPGLYSKHGNHTSSQSIGDNTSDDCVHSGSKPPLVAAVAAEYASQHDWTVTAIKTDVEQLKITAAVTKVELEDIKVSLNEVKRDLKDLGNKIDRKSDKTDAKIDRMIYFFIGGLMLKGGFDLFIKRDKTETKDMGVGK